MDNAGWNAKAFAGMKYFDLISNAQGQRALSHHEVLRERMHMRRRPWSVRSQGEFQPGIYRPPTIGSAGIRQLVERRTTQGNEPIKTGNEIAALVESCVAHEIHRGPVLLKADAIQVSTILHANQIRYLNGINRACAMARHHPGGHGVLGRVQLVGSQGKVRVERVRANPRHIPKQALGHS